MTAPPRYGRTFWIASVAGWAVVAYGLVGVFRDSERTHPASMARWFIGSALVHDLALAPVVVAAGVVAARVLPARVRPWATAWLIVAGSVTVYALPFLLGHGRRPTDPSALPNDYRQGLVTVLAVTAGLAATVVLARRVVLSRRGPR